MRIRVGGIKGDGLISRLLFGLAKHPAVGWMVRLGFSYGSFLLPVRRVQETPRVIAFEHPRPFYPGHIVIVPKKPLATFLDFLDRAPDYLDEILVVAREIVRELGWASFVLGVNGGTRQEVPQVHFHLYTECIPVTPFSNSLPDDVVENTNRARILMHPEPDEAVHVLVCCPSSLGLDGVGVPGSPKVATILGCLPELDRQYCLVKKGYTVFVQADRLPEDCGIIFHVVAGERIK